MDKVAYFKGIEIAREKAVEPKVNDKFNVSELNEFYHRISRNFKYDNSNRSNIEYFCRYE